MREKARYSMIVFLCLCILVGCNDARPVKRDNQKDQGNASVDNGQNSSFSESAYREKICKDRTNLKKYQEQYQEDISQVQKNDFRKLSFDQCVFAELPDSDSVSVLDPGERGVSVEESISIIKNWLVDIGQEDIDLDKELRVVTSQLEWDDSQEPPYCYPSVMEHRGELTSGHGFFVNTNSCHALVLADGICSMSDGTITRYLGEDGHAEADAGGAYQEEIVAKGSFDEMASQSYELLSGEISVREAAEVVKRYFEAGTPFPPAKDVEIDIPYVSVFSLGDKYGYSFEMRRVYQNIPFAYAYSAEERRARSGSEDCMVAYVVNNQTVSAYHGFDAAQPFQVLVEESDILSLKDAMELLDSKLANELQAQIEYVGLAYCTICLDEEKETYVVYPCWALDGLVENNNRRIRIYMDVLTGDVYLYTQVQTEDADE